MTSPTPDSVKVAKSVACLHCNGDVEIRNPTGSCDHLYYPDCCKTCQRIIKALNTYGNSRWDEAYEKGFWASWEQSHTDHVIVDVGENAAGKAKHCNNCREMKVLPPFKVGENK